MFCVGFCWDIIKCYRGIFDSLYEVGLKCVYQFIRELNKVESIIVVYV